MGCASRAQGERASEAVDGVPVEMDLQYRDIEKSASAAISLCALDESDDRTLIRRQYGIKLSAISVGRLLAQMGLSCQKPLSRAFEQDATLVKQWIERDFPKIALWRKSSVLSCFLPMRAACDLTFMPGRPGGYAGKPLLSATLANANLNMLSAISAKGELRFMTSRKRLSAALFIEFLRRLITNYPKKIFLVVDGLPAHKAKSVHRFVHQVKDRLRLSLSRRLAGNQSGRTGLEQRQEPRRCSNIDPRPRDLHRAVSSRLRLLQKNPGKVRAFFQMETTRYAAA